MKPFWDRVDGVALDIGASRVVVLVLSAALWVMIATFAARWYCSG